jgi:hypothetical protein
MDTKTLTVGQNIWMQSGDLFKETTVTEITDKYVQAEPVLFAQNERPYMIRFDKNGKQPVLENYIFKAWDGLGVYERLFDGWWQEDRRPLCGDGHKPWELVER